MKWWLLAFSFLWLTTAAGGENRGPGVVATVGDETITQQELDELTSSIPEPFRGVFAADLLEKLIDTKVFGKEALKAGLDKSPEFKAKLEKEKLRVLGEFFVEERIDKEIVVSPAEVEAYYGEHKNEFKSPEMVGVAEIVVRTREEGQQVKARLAGGEAFEKLAREYTSGSGSQVQGSLRWWQRGQRPRALEDAAFNLRKGDISSVIETPRGFHVIKVVDRRDARLQSLEEARPIIERKLKSNKSAEVKRQYRERAGAKIVDDKYRKILMERPGQ